MTAQSDKRLIEVAFPLKQTSLDSVHEKNVCHGHISTLHIWPARRPLAASRAALITTLLPDPGDPEKRKEILRRLAGIVVEKIENKKIGGKTVEVRKEETVGGILHWGRETGPDLDWFRQEIRKAYGGRAPKVLDPFAGGGAIPLEAMRLGCEVTAIDINPVAWFILKCTLEYPQKLAGQTRPLPAFVLRDREFMESFLKAKGFRGALLRTYLQKLGLEGGPSSPLWVDELNQAFDEAYLKDPRNPRWVVKPTVAYLWARTVACKQCRATVPLLKTRWLAKKDNKRVLLTMEPNAERTEGVFGVQNNVPLTGGNAAQRRENDKRLGQGTMSRSGAKCPCCGVITMMDDIRVHGRTRGLGFQLIAVVVSTQEGKEYRAPMRDELDILKDVDLNVNASLKDLDRLSLDERLYPASTRSISCHLYGVEKYRDLFTARQTLALATFGKSINTSTQIFDKFGYERDWARAIASYLALSFDRLLSFTCVNVRWKPDAEAVVDAFSRFSLSLLWDFGEPNPVGDGAGAWITCNGRIATALDTYTGIRTNLGESR